MKFLKKLARKILKDEIKEYEKEEERHLVYQKEHAETYAKLADMFKNECNTVEFLSKKLQRLEQENIIMREYYKLDEEPSEEIQTKIRINLKIHELEIDKLSAHQQISELCAAINAMRPAYSPFNYYGKY